MAFEIVLSPEALEDFAGFGGAIRATVRKALEIHLRHHPARTSKSRIKRLRNLRQPQYRLRIDQIRIYYDVNDTEARVEILRILPKHLFLEQKGIPHEDTPTDEGEG